MKIKTGNVSQAKTVKAGCGMRYDPEQLGDHTGFDFPGVDLWNTLFKESKKSPDLPETEKDKGQD